MKVFNQANEFFLNPINYASTVVDAPADEATFCDSLMVRVCLLTQFVFSIVALPVLLIIGLITAGVNLCSSSEENVFTPIKNGLKLHALVVIPLSIVGILAPLHITNDLADSLLECLS